MQIPRNALLLRIFIGEDDKCGHAPLYEAIVLKAREMHLAGATVLRGPMGFGHSSRLHTAKILRLSEDLPMVIEIVDAEDKVNAFVAVLEGMMTSGLVTLEKVQAMMGRRSICGTTKPKPSSGCGMSARRQPSVTVADEAYGMPSRRCARPGSV